MNWKEDFYNMFQFSPIPQQQMVIDHLTIYSCEFLYLILFLCDVLSKWKLKTIAMEFC